MTFSSHTVPRVVGLVVLSAAAALHWSAPVQADGPRLMPTWRDRGEDVSDLVRIKQERKAFDAAYEAYQLSAKLYRTEVKDFIGREVRGRQKAIGQSYQGQIDQLEQAQFDLRREAIARLEAFVFRHRDHELYTPDTLFRLAELYYEDTIASYNRGLDNYDRDLDLYNRGKLLDPPSDPERDFSRSVAIYKYLHWVPKGTRMEPLSGRLAGVVLEQRWPNYRHADAAMYLQGYCEYEGGNISAAIDTLSNLEPHYPQSKYVAEAWLRVGEMYFDDSEFEEAAKAYERAATRALEMGDRKNYSLALYKLGWSNFQLYKYPVAVRWFQKLIEYEDQYADKGEEAGKFDLRKEAIEYLAKSLAEPSWDDDGCDDFGGEDVKDACVQLDPRLRPRLYVASVLPPSFDDFPTWQQVLQGPVAEGVNRNLAARNAVRQGLINGKPYVYEILTTYGNTLYDQSLVDYYRQAILVLGYVVDNWPQAREAQALQRKVIRAVDILASELASWQALMAKDPGNPEVIRGVAMALADQERQVAERRKYLALFGKGTAWYDKWGEDKDLAAQVEDTTKDIRYQFAQLIHMQAQALKATGQHDAALAKYAEAAREYELLLRSDIESPNAYALAWTLAETLFFAGERCDGIRDGDGVLLRGADGELLAYPPEAVASLKEACASMRKSVEYYEMIRDWQRARTAGEDGKPLDFKEESAYTAILASSKVLNARAAMPANDPEHLSSRMLPELRPSAAEDEAAMALVKDELKVVPVTPMPVDEVAVAWLQSVDGYLGNGITNKDDPDRPQKLALQAAELLYKNRHFDPWQEGKTDKTPPEFWSARKRFWWIIDNFPMSKQALEAIKNLLTSYTIERDFAQLAVIRDEMEKRGLGSAEERKKLGDEIKQFNLGVLAEEADAILKRADEVLDQGLAAADNPEAAGKLLEQARADYDTAGDMYRKLRAETNKTEQKLGALMNGMRSYYRAEKWQKCFDVLVEAEQMLRSVQTNDPAEQRKNKERLETVVITRADLNYKFFNIPEAIADYQILYENDKNGPKAADYLRSAADLAFFNSNWDLAVQLDKEIIARYEKDRDVKTTELVQNSAWRIQEAWQRKGAIDKRIDAIEAYIDRYAADRVQSGRVFKAYAIMADIYEGRGDKKNADKIWKRILDAFERGGYEKNGGPEATAAAQATFNQMLPRYEAFMATTLKENPKLSPTRQMEAMQKQVLGMMDTALGPIKKIKQADGTEVEGRSGGMYDQYGTDVGGYGSRDWSYAAFLYRAKMLQYLARTIYGAPVPPDLEPEEEEQLMEILEQFGAQIENQALRSLEAALKDAEAKGVVNDWVSELRKEINRYKPAEYPLLKDEKRLTVDPAGTLPTPVKELR